MPRKKKPEPGNDRRDPAATAIRLALEDYRRKEGGCVPMDHQRTRLISDCVRMAVFPDHAVSVELRITTAWREMSLVQKISNFLGWLLLPREMNGAYRSARERQLSAREARSPRIPRIPRENLRHPRNTAEIEITLFTRPSEEFPDGMRDYRFVIEEGGVV